MWFCIVKWIKSNIPPIYDSYVKTGLQFQCSQLCSKMVNWQNTSNWLFSTTLQMKTKRAKLATLHSYILLDLLHANLKHTVKVGQIISFVLKRFQRFWQGLVQDLTKQKSTLFYEIVYIQHSLENSNFLIISLRSLRFSIYETQEIWLIWGNSSNHFAKKFS